MPHIELSARRLILAGGFALAVAAAPAVAAFAVPPNAAGIHLADDCAPGEDADEFTGSCVPFAVPNSPAPDFTTPAGNPDIPEIDGVPCTGRDSGACIGLAEDAPQYVPPTSSVGSDPTVTGSTN
ncbi:intersectin-EH binding protein Ibp1 [Mycobacterium yunnanensis]|uniref:Intersectin-EH binding protein Ibp1 n=1 Tax=Mycobacterium yunnanensis TaxID=368477 RepID=A0A9X2YY35_9MYCO|nr:intersectin-EH binding protein Ibp1 [Mycobacterium yunnanensis]MCV7419012.1 intersectin-EH binding protein Ibp1 [Mycobacterium yunnanensis]